jgi:anti-sigma regulatory factor (Ser/Thr protein kinase)
MKLLRRPFLPDGTEDMPAILQNLLCPGSWVVEAGCAPPKQHHPGRLLAGQALPDRMAASLKTATMLRLNLGTILSDTLGRLGCTLEPLAELALHEMLVNSAVHGNLGVAAGPATTWGDLAAREKLLAAALENPDLAARIVTVAAGWDARRVCTVIIDQGSGYSSKTATGSFANAARRASGRGLMIARSAATVTALHGGRCTRLVFARAMA